MGLGGVGQLSFNADPQREKLVHEHPSSLMGERGPWGGETPHRLPGQPSCPHESSATSKGVGGSANPSLSVETQYQDSILPLVDYQRHCLLQRAASPEGGACTQGSEGPTAVAEQQGAVLSGASRQGHSPAPPPPAPGGAPDRSPWAPLWVSVSSVIKRDRPAHSRKGFSGS